MSAPSPSPGEIYEREMVPAIFARWAPVLIELALVERGQAVLDVACGTGVVTRLLVDRVGAGGRVVGLDLNPAMLLAARANSKSPQIEWLEASALSIPMPDSAFDAVVCQQGLQFFPDKTAALREMRRVLRPGGRLALAVWRSIEHSPAFHVLQQAIGQRIGAEKAALPPFSFGDGEAIRKVVVEAGFSSIRVVTDSRAARFPSPEGMVRTIVGGAPSMMAVLAEQGDAALRAIIAEMGERTRAYVDDEGFAFPMASYLVTARR